MLLWSFEGARCLSLDEQNHAVSTARAFHNFGGLTGRETPLPIPNREVKPARADGTRRATSRESRSPPINFAKPAFGRLRSFRPKCEHFGRPQTACALRASICAGRRRAAGFGDPAESARPSHA